MGLKYNYVLMTEISPTQQLNINNTKFYRISQRNISNTILIPHRPKSTRSASSKGTKSKTSPNQNIVSHIIKVRT